MLFDAVLATAAVTLLATVPSPASAQEPVCTGSRSEVLCARYIRPYSDNAYTWNVGPFCNFTAAPTALIADNVERYDYGYNCSGSYVATCCDHWTSCAIAVDCSGPETALPETTTNLDGELPNNWVTAVPCAVDNADRVLTNTIVTYLQSNTPYRCPEACAKKGYQYAGVEYGDECYCGTGYTGGVKPQAADPSECSMTCPGSYYFSCGGSWRMQIFKAPYAP
ncbi:hypothetical protein BDY19DRAFT_969428 [Irpex rosettiformis]|uniref:Uncharacterized protein n=1 Tax=Irpex rosettiformis TaxID=378272 RepID=A0ACB8TS66_9APHY|nr:hypothetical protein BDY19DRAFT_969428 [Irpex rosettiformis]